MNNLSKTLFIALLCCLSCSQQPSYSEVMNNIEKPAAPLPEKTIQQYAEELKKVIDQNWQPPENLSSEDLKVLFTISRDGKLLKSKLINPSQHKELNNSAIEAIQKSFPYKSLPTSYVPDTLNIEYVFDYNVFSKEVNKLASINKYMETLKKDLLLNWNVLGSNENLKTTVVFKINNKGKILKQNIIVTSGDPEFDNMVLMALKKASPFYHLPLNYNKESLNIKALFHFDENPNIQISELSEFEVPRNFLPIAKNEIKPDLNTSQSVNTIDPNKKGNYRTYKALYKDWNGQIITPNAAKLNLKLTNKDNKLFISIDNKEYQVQNVQMKQSDSFTFSILTGQKDNSQLLFEGKLRQKQLKGTTKDINGLEGYWYLDQI